MNDAQAQEILKPYLFESQYGVRMFHADHSAKGPFPVVRVYGPTPDNTICLNGEFSKEQLQAFIWAMEHHPYVKGA